jgi:hypothetical protein
LAVSLSIHKLIFSKKSSQFDQLRNKSTNLGQFFF